MTKTKLSELIREAAWRIPPNCAGAEFTAAKLLAEADRLDAGPSEWPKSSGLHSWRQGWLAACGGEVDGK